MASVSMHAIAVLLVTLADTGGVIQGTVSFDRAFRPPVINLDSDPKCVALHGGEEQPRHDFLVIGENLGLANVLVQVIENIPAGDYPVPEEPLVLSQKGCQYEPHVFVVRPGQQIKVLNPDETLHNIHFLPNRNPEFNKSMAENRKEIEHVLDKAEPVFPIQCEVHAWMKAFCAVIEHPFYDVTGTDGGFAIKGLPEGTYTIEFWHERLGTQTQEVTVPANGVATVDVGFEMPTRGGR